jgi:hypothetical protein
MFVSLSLELARSLVLGLLVPPFFIDTKLN